LSPGGKTLALLDTNALLPPRLSDILFDMCLERLYCPRWKKKDRGRVRHAFSARSPRQEQSGGKGNQSGAARSGARGEGETSLEVLSRRRRHRA
jgi:hypothetical protein